MQFRSENALLVLLVYFRGNLQIPLFENNKLLA
jgi:hypothetical protein